MLVDVVKQIENLRIGDRFWFWLCPEVEDDSPILLLQPLVTESFKRLQNLKPGRTCWLWLFFSIACNVEQKTSGDGVYTGNEPEVTDTFEGKSYQLVNAEGFQPVNGTHIILHFLEDARFRVDTACNTIDGRYSIDQDTMHIDKFGMTEMGCSDELTAQEEFLAAFFPAHPSLTTYGSSLTLSAIGATLNFMDQEVVEPEVNVGRTNWIITHLVEDDILDPINIASPPTLYFDESGWFEVFTGCSNCLSNYGVDGQQLNFSNLECDIATCSSSQAEVVEAHILDVFFGSALVIRMEGEQLLISDREIGLLASPN